MKEPKKATTYEEQIRILQSRGMIIDDEAFCIQKLSEINYYRFSAYFLPFRRQDGSYIEGVHFQKVYRIYEFDRKLRGILFSAIEEIEIFLKSRLAYFHAHQYGALGYLNPANFSAAHRADKFSGNIQREIQNNKKVLFVKHHIENYDGQFPIWVIVELFTFGMISRFYADMPRSDQKKLAKKIYNTVPPNMVSWLRCVTDLRNICAHYGRLYFRIFSAVPAGLGLRTAAERRLWGAVLALKSLYPDHNKWDAEILPGIQALFEEYQNDIDLYHIAFPKDWDQQLAFSRSV
ncbi:MAG: Abi family protein [Subdoligranulum sp.]|nr:Abi family protein [Subdoligranulum sp.]